MNGRRRVGEHLLWAMLTTEPNAVVRPIHAKAMPVMLTRVNEALELQWPLPAEMLQIVANGEREDAASVPNEAERHIATPIPG